MLCGRTAPLNRVITLLIIFAIFTILVSAHKLHHDTETAHSISYSVSQEFPPNIESQIHNETLGFQTIFVLNDTEHITDLTSLKQAAKATNLTLSFLDDEPTDAELEPFSSSEQQELRRSTPSWYAHTSHVRAIRQILSSRLSSALILESSADWDISIQNQLSAFASAVHRTLYSYMGGRHTHTGASSYGMDWDVLWLGHCSGDAPPPKMRMHDTAILDDGTVPPAFASSGFCAAGKSERDEGCEAPKKRTVQIAAAPNCTTAYAVSASGAAKLLLMLDERYISSDTAFRTALRDFCAGGEGLCLSVSPPLFGRFKGVGRIDGDAVKGEPGFESGYRDVGVTRGVVMSARINAERLKKGESAVSQFIEGENGWRFRGAREYPNQKTVYGSRFSGSGPGEGKSGNGGVWKGRMPAHKSGVPVEEI